MRWVRTFEGQRLDYMVGSIMAPKNVRALFVRTCEYVTIQRKGDFAVLTKVKEFEMVRLSWIIQVGII